MSTLYSRSPIGEPKVELNPVSLDQGRLLATVTFGDGLTYISLTDIAEARTLIRAFERAAELLDLGQHQLNRRSAEGRRICHEDEGHAFARPGQVSPDQPAPDKCMECGRPEAEHDGGAGKDEDAPDGHDD